MLGNTSGYEVFVSESLNATVVDTRRGGERRVLLISLGADGAPQVEDLTGDLTLAAGRGLMVGLDGLDVDFERFASAGTLAVHPAPDHPEHDRAGEVNIGRQIALERTRASAAGAKE